MGELFFMACIAAVCIAMFVMTGNFPVSVIDDSGGPALFPRIVIVFLIAVMAVRAAAVARDRKLLAQKFVFFSLFRGNSLIYLLLFVGYAVTMPFFGFVAGTALFLIASMAFLYSRQNGKTPGFHAALLIAAGSVAGTLAVHYAFSSLLNIVLPVGVWG